MKLSWARNRRFLTALSLGGLFVLYLLYGLSHYDPDFGWHLQAGRYILAHGIPARDIFSYTARGFPWIDHEWLNDAVVAGLFRLGGYLAVAAVFAALWTAALAAASRQHRTVLWLTAIATIPYCGVRTVTWSVVFLVLLERLLAARRYWLLAPLFLLWANLHGSFILGLGLLAIEAVRRRLALVWMACAAVTFVNPYGPHLYTEVFRTLLDPRLHSAIQEWRPLSFPWQTWPFWFLFLAVIVVYRPRASRQAVWAALLGAMALASTRHTPLFAVAAIPVFEMAAGRLTADFRQSRLGARLLWPGLAVMLVAVPLAAEAAGGGFNQNPNRDYPAAAAAYLRQHPCPGNTFNTYNEGGYLIWKLGRADYIDGRMPSWKLGGTGSLEQYWAFVSSQPSRAAQEAQYNIRCAIIPSGTVPAQGKRYDLANAFGHEGWRRVYSDSAFQVWKR